MCDLGEKVPIQNTMYSDGISIFDERSRCQRPSIDETLITVADLVYDHTENPSCPCPVNPSRHLSTRLTKIFILWVCHKD